MKTVLVLLMLVALVIVIGAVLANGAKKTRRTGAYRRRKLMTDNEQEFFGQLVAALPDHYVFPQVAMSALIESASGDKKTAHSDRLKIPQQRSDYIVCTKNCDVVAVIELDDRTHSAAKDALRDARLEQAGIRTVRFQSRNKPTVAALRVAILGTAVAVPIPITPSAASSSLPLPAKIAEAVSST